MQRKSGSRVAALILIGGAVLIVPPLLWIAGVLLYAVVSYTGTCPGLMDIPPYSCTLWEYIGRNTISPFALIGNLTIIGGWMLFALIIDAFMAALVFVMHVFERRKR